MKKIATALALLCAIVLSAQNYNPIINYNFNGTPTNGVKINTNIPFENGSGMPTLIIEGFNFGGSSTIGLTLNWYVYNNSFYRKSISSFGGYTPEVKLYNENGKVVIFINDKKYYNRFTIRGYEIAKSLNDTHFQGWTITDELPTGSNETVMVYKNKFAGTVEVDGKIGVGTDDPKAHLEVATFIPNGTLGSVFGRLEEGNVTGDGTYLGVKGHKTQGDPNTIKSFSLVHNFYGQTNSSVNFYRGSDVLGGFLTFNTSDDTERMRINYDGNVGIGTTSPGSKLHVAGSGAIIKLQNTSFEDTDNQFHGWLGGYDKSGDEIWWIGEGSSTSKQLGLFTNRAGYDLKLFNKGNGIIVKGDGNVGIGTEDTKGFKLGVNGKIAATEVKVANYANWADFVFKKEYKLPSLEEVESHIKRKGHLQNIPSEKEVARNGFYLAEMDAKLLQKIEELTLYTIQQEKEIKKTKEENKNLKLVLKKLEERLSKLEKKQ